MTLRQNKTVDRLRRIAARPRAPGNMLLIVALVASVLFVVAGFALAIYMMVFAQRRAQSEADALALAAAESLNAGDYAGRMNNMIACSRELVFLSRQCYMGASDGYPHLMPLANQLLEESRESARLLDSERKHLIQIKLDSARAALKKAESQSRSSSAMTLPWMTSYAPQVVSLKVGFIDGVLSNAQCSDGIPDLKVEDLRRGFIQKESGFFYGNINAKLPVPDNDLPFKISSLPPPVTGTLAPARLTSAVVFKPSALILENGASVGTHCDQLPSAVQLGMVMRITAGATVKKEHEHDVQTAATAAAGGGSPLP